MHYNYVIRLGIKGNLHNINQYENHLHISVSLRWWISWSKVSHNNVTYRRYCGREGTSDFRLQTFENSFGFVGLSAVAVVKNSPTLWFLSKHFQASAMFRCSTFNFLLIFRTNVEKLHFQPLVTVGNLCWDTDVAFIVFDCVNENSMNPRIDNFALRNT